jgi:hypothetical protein
LLLRVWEELLPVAPLSLPVGFQNSLGRKVTRVSSCNSLGEIISEAADATNGRIWGFDVLNLR